MYILYICIISLLLGFLLKAAGPECEQVLAHRNSIMILSAYSYFRLALESDKQVDKKNIGPNGYCALSRSIEMQDPWIPYWHLHLLDGVG